MKIDVKSESAVKKTFTVSVPEERLQSEFDVAYKKLAHDAQIPGFRKGKVPLTILKERFGASVENEVLETLMQESMIKAFEEHSLEPVARPKVTEHRRDAGKGFQFSADVEVKPQFEMKDYEGVKVTKPSVEVKDEQVKELLGRLQNEQAVLKDRADATTPSKGDFVALTMNGLDEAGNPLTAGQDPQERTYEIGGEILHEEMEKQVLKMKIGEMADVTIHPKAKDAKDLRVRILLKGIKEKVLPTLDDEFAKSIGPFENLEALKTRATEDLKNEMEEKARGEMIEKILETIRTKNPLELPTTLVESELFGMMYGLWQRLEQAGIKELPKEYTAEELRPKMLPEAQRRVHDQLLIEAIAKKENLTVDEKEVNERLRRVSEAGKTPYAEVRAQYEKSGRLDSLRSHILVQKTLDFLVSKAHIK